MGKFSLLLSVKHALHSHVCDNILCLFKSFSVLNVRLHSIQLQRNDDLKIDGGDHYNINNNNKNNSIHYFHHLKYYKRNVVKWLYLHIQTNYLFSLLL